jgi:hypothetical protein
MTICAALVAALATVAFGMLAPHGLCVTVAETGHPVAVSRSPDGFWNCLATALVVLLALLGLGVSLRDFGATFAASFDGGRANGTRAVFLLLLTIVVLTVFFAFFLQPAWCAEVGAHLTR